MKRSPLRRDRPDVAGIRGGIWAAVIGVLLLAAVSAWAIATDVVVESCDQGSALHEPGVQGC